MKFGTILLVVAIVLLVAGAAFGLAQADADSISGTWGAQGQPFLELKYDGKSAVSGTVYWRGNGSEQRTPIKTGTFDSKTRAFKLEGDAKRPDNGEPTTYTIEGTVESDAVTGTYRLSTVSGTFRFTKMS